MNKSDKNNQVNILWEDLIDAFKSAPERLYFIGPMVLEGDENNSTQFIVIDGQQRLTTITLLFTSLKCLLNDLKRNKQFDSTKEEDITASISYITDEITQLLFNKMPRPKAEIEKKVKIETNTDFNYDDILKSVLSCNRGIFSKKENKHTLESTYTIKIGDDIPKNITIEQKKILEKYFNNAQFFYDEIGKEFLIDNKLTLESIEKIQDYFKFLTEKVAIVPIIAKEFDDAYKIFEVLNNRGLPLSNKDLFRNFVIREFSNAKKNYPDIEPEKAWNYLETDLQIDENFISRYVETTNASKQRYSAYNDLVTTIYAKRFDKDIFSLYNDIKINLSNYRTIIEADFINKQLRSKVLFLLNAPNATFAVDLLICLLKNTDNEQKRLLFINEYESYLLLVAFGDIRFKASNVFDAIKLLNNNQFEHAFNLFKLTKEHKEKLKNNINNPILDNDIAKLLIAKYVWIQEYLLKHEDLSDLFLHYDKATLEHIIPQEPAKDTNWLLMDAKFRKDYTYKLGNMTLMTQVQNSANKNFDFSIKRKNYAKTSLFITQRISLLETIHEQNIKTWHNEFVDAIYSDMGIY